MDAQDPQGAAAALVRARDSARDDTQRFLSEHLLRRLGEATAGTVVARGRLTTSNAARAARSTSSSKPTRPPSRAAWIWCCAARPATPLRQPAPAPAAREHARRGAPAGRLRRPAAAELVCGPQRGW
jgi:hypothetical protein